MADYIVLTTGNLNNESVVVVHSVIPAGTNVAGKTWAQALVDERGGGPFVSAVPASELPGGRQAALDAGTVFEWVKTYGYNANATNVDKQATIETAINVDEPQMLEDVQDRLRFYGFIGTS
jgi:hypothetical protein